MKKIISIACVLTCALALNAQSLSTGVQYVGVAAAANAVKQQQAQALGAEVSTKVAFQMDLELSGRVRWGYISISSTDIPFLTLGGNRTITGGPGANIDLGIRVNDSYFIGVGAQFAANFGQTKATLGSIKRGSNVTVQVTNFSVPIYGLFKVYIPNSINVTPYFALALGGYLPDWYSLKSDALVIDPLDIPEGSDVKVNDNRIEFRAEKGGFYGHAAVGIDINHFQLSAGYELTVVTANANTRSYNNIFVKIGYRIGG